MDVKVRKVVERYNMAGPVLLLREQRSMFG